MFNLKFTPELVIILPFAIGLDVIGFLVTVCGWDDLGLLDLCGMFVIFSWLLLRGKKVPMKHSGIMGKISNLFTNKYLRFITPALGELTPVLGGIGFFWTATVLFNVMEAGPEPDPEMQMRAMSGSESGPASEG